MSLGTEVQHSVSFFFSSRRRHTRCSRDWSSDVCSSDLSQWWNSTRPQAGRRRGDATTVDGVISADTSRRRIGRVWRGTRFVLRRVAEDNVRMPDERASWNQRYRERSPSSLEPDPLLVTSYEEFIQP